MIGITAAATLFLAGLASGGGNFIFPYLALPDHLMAWNAATGILVAALIAAMSRKRPQISMPSPKYTLPAAILSTYLVQYAAKAAWPNAADEYGYLFQADTFLHGRLWNQAPASPIFEFAWISNRDGKWFSQYPPAWSAIIAPFLAVGAPWLLNPLLTGLLGWLEWRALRLRAVPVSAAGAVTAILVFSPFALFNGASYFPHVWMAVLILASVVLDLRDQKNSAWPNKIMLGGIYGLMLLTRYEGVVLAALCYAANRLVRRRHNWKTDLMWVCLGGTPFMLVFMIYNHAITGHAFRTPYAWSSPGAHIGLQIVQYGGLAAALAHALRQTLHWTSELIGYTGLLTVIAWAAALWHLARSRNLEWSDALFPATLIFFFFYPASGGHEFGPRYWFFAWPTAMLTAGAAFGDRGIPLARSMTVRLPDFAAAQIIVFCGMACSLAAFNRAYVTQRQAVYRIQAEAEPAIILIPSRELTLSALQQAPIDAWANDFTRNGVDLTGSILFAMADNHFNRQDEFSRDACALKGRTIFRYSAQRQLQPVDCAQYTPAGAQ